MLKAVSEKQSEILGVKTYVLDDGRVVVTTTHMHEVFALQRPGNISTEDQRTQLPRFAASKSLKPFVSAELTTGLNSPVVFMLPQGGATAYGYDSDIITDIALAIMKASIAGVLYTRQRKMAQAAAAFVSATSKIGSRLALLDEHGMQPKSGAAQELHEGLAAEVRTLQADLDRTLITLREQSAGNARGWAKVGDLERQVRALSAGPISQQQLEWMKETMREVASLRRRVTAHLSFEQVYARVQTAIRESMRYTLEWDEFPYSRFDDLRERLRRMHKIATKEAREVGYTGADTWRQPPLPFIEGEADDDEDQTVDVP